MIVFNDLIDAGIESIVNGQVKENYKSIYDYIIYLENEGHSPNKIVEVIKGKLRDLML